MYVSIKLLQYKCILETLTETVTGFIPASIHFLRYIHTSSSTYKSKFITKPFLSKNGIKFNLEVSNYEVSYSYDGFDGFIKAKEIKPDLIL
ncbi:hypothetical protein BM534_22275, partial [Clostridioides difficile]